MTTWSWTDLPATPPLHLGVRSGHHALFMFIIATIVPLTTSNQQQLLFWDLSYTWAVELQNSSCWIKVRVLNVWIVRTTVWRCKRVRIPPLLRPAHLQCHGWEVSRNLAGPDSPFSLQVKPTGQPQLDSQDLDHHQLRYRNSQSGLSSRFFAHSLPLST